MYVEEPGLSRLVLHEVRTDPEYFDSMLHKLQVRYTDFAMRTVREAVESGELPPDTDEEMVRSMVYGGIEHRMWATLFGRGTVDIEATADRLSDMLLRGILAPGVTRAAAVATAAPHTPGARDDLEHRLAKLERIVAGDSLKTAPVAKRQRARQA